MKPKTQAMSRVMRRVIWNDFDKRQGYWISWCRLECGHYIRHRYFPLIREPTPPEPPEELACDLCSGLLTQTLETK